MTKVQPFYPTLYELYCSGLFIYETNVILGSLKIVSLQIRLFYIMIIFSSLHNDAIFYFIYYITIFIVRNDLINEFNRISRSILFILCLYWIHLIYNVIIFSSLHYDTILYFIYYITIFIVRNDLINELDQINRSIFFILRL